MYTNNYQHTTGRRYCNETNAIVSRDLHKVSTKSMSDIYKAKIKVKYFKYDYVSFYNKVFGLELSSKRDRELAVMGVPD